MGVVSLGGCGLTCSTRVEKLSGRRVEERERWSWKEAMQSSLSLISTTILCRRITYSYPHACCRGQGEGAGGSQNSVGPASKGVF